MTNAFTLFRSLIIYSIILPAAIIIGYLLATPLDQGSFITVSLVLALLTVPIFLRWHYPLMLLAWNFNAILFFLPGRPQFSALLILISFGISVLQYIMNRQMKFISVPMIAKPLLFILLVILLTARLTGGIGLNALGAEGSVGGKRYIYLFLGIIGFFALAALRIPPHKRKLYTLLYFIGYLSMIIANFAYIITPNLYFIFLIFPTDSGGMATLTESTSVVGSVSFTRLGGLSTACLALISMMLAFYGIRGIIDLRKSWRLPLALVVAGASLFGGFRSQVIILFMTVAVMFYLEGLMRSRLLPIVILIFVLGGALVIPFVQKLPLSVQRSLAFLPIDIDMDAELNAKASTEWRVQMWQEVIPQIPQYLILGKGLGINLHDLDMQREHLGRGEIGAAGSMLAGDYHNGPLSLIITFGIFGTIGFIWLLVAGCKVLYRNYKNGDADLVLINRFLLAQFIVKIFTFFLVFGSFYSDLAGFAGILGLSVALNHGVASPKTEPVTRPVFNKFKLANVAR